MTYGTKKVGQFMLFGIVMGSLWESVTKSKKEIVNFVLLSVLAHQSKVHVPLDEEEKQNRGGRGRPRRKTLSPGPAGHVCGPQKPAARPVGTETNVLASETEHFACLKPKDSSTNATQNAKPLTRRARATPSAR